MQCIQIYWNGRLLWGPLQITYRWCGWVKEMVLRRGNLNDNMNIRTRRQRRVSGYGTDKNPQVSIALPSWTCSPWSNISWFRLQLPLRTGKKERKIEAYVRIAGEAVRFNCGITHVWDYVRTINSSLNIPIADNMQDGGPYLNHSLLIGHWPRNDTGRLSHGCESGNLCRHYKPLRLFIRHDRWRHDRLWQGTSAQTVSIWGTRRKTNVTPRQYIYDLLSWAAVTKNIRVP